MTMGGRLTEGDMDRLEQWIGKGPKTFSLLYAITRDGCNATTFHQKCNNQGPTVTVLYNQQGSVYGGYSSTSWNGTGSWVNTTDSFLFQLQYNSSPKVNKFTLKQTGYQHSILCNSNYGPIFGSGHDLCTFTSTVNNAGGYFPLNGHMSIGSSYDNQGITKDQINNGNMNVTELEVYRVADGQRKKLVTPNASELPKENLPWRKTKTWNEQFLKELTEKIVSFRPVDDVKVTEARILMIGPIGAGKSSFYNTINSVFRGRITNRASSGSAEQSLTTTYIPYYVKVQSGASLNFRLCDTRGLEESAGISDVECNFLLDGNIPDYYQFSLTPISLKTPGLKFDPTPDDQIHCAVFVLDSTTLNVLSPKIVEKMKGFKNLMNQKGIPHVIVLTKIDKLCKDVQKDVSFVFKSKTVEQNVEKAAQLLGLPPGSVLPVKNYATEIEIEDDVSILALLALRQILNFAEDFMENLSEKNKQLHKHMEKLKLEK